MQTGRYAKIFFGKIETKARTRLSIFFKKNFAKPDGIYYLISNKCNFHCAMCDQWKKGLTEKEGDYISPARMKELLAEAAGWGVKSFGVSGGEPLVYREKTFVLLREANRLGLHSHFVTNGWLLTEDIINEYERIGGGHISLSLDAAGPLHDELRGVPGAFAKVQEIFKIFQRVNPKNILLKVNLVISDQNLDEVLPVVDLVEKSGASIFFQPFDPYNWHNRKSLNQKEYHATYPLWVSEEHQEKLKPVIDRLIAIKKKKPGLILNSVEHLQAMIKYFAANLNRPNCYVGYQSLVINPTGEVAVCKYGSVGDAKVESLKSIWAGEKYERVRRDSANCNFDCLLGCMY
ncbi:MAG: radical SAM protein, partial [Parcubacteria group bacterium]